jgi:hypothetical protein
MFPPKAERTHRPRPRAPAAPPSRPAARASPHRGWPPWEGFHEGAHNSTGISIRPLQNQQGSHEGLLQFNRDFNRALKTQQGFHLASLRASIADRSLTSTSNVPARGPQVARPPLSTVASRKVKLSQLGRPVPARRVPKHLCELTLSLSSSECVIPAAIFL